MLSRQSNYTTLGTEELNGALTALTHRREQAESDGDLYLSTYYQGAHDVLWAVSAHRLDTQADLLLVLDSLIEMQKEKGAK